MCRLVAVAVIVFAAGKVFAACQGTYPHTPTVCSAVTATIHVPGGAYPAPYVITQPDTEYILDGDIDAAGTGVTINASNIVLNLNGHKITYNQTAPGEGVNNDVYNMHDIAIVNGLIEQGALNSDGSYYGVNNNPILYKNGITRSYIADISSKHRGKDVGGFFLKGDSALVEYCTVEDLFNWGVFLDRHAGITAIRPCDTNFEARHNVVVNARQAGIGIADNSLVHHNTISVLSSSTNCAAVGGWAPRNSKIYNNNITGRGEHPIGIMLSGVTDDPAHGVENIEVYNNIIDVQATRMGSEYGQNPITCTEATPCKTDNATGMRIHKEGHNVYIHDNTVTLRTDQKFQGIYTPTGETIWLASQGRGIQIGCGGTQGTGSLTVVNNTITAMDKTGDWVPGETGNRPIGGLVCDTNYPNGTLIAAFNTVTSNMAPLVLGDEYGWCQGDPLFIQNTFIKSIAFEGVPAHPEHFATISSGYSGYYSGTGRLISNIYQGGAAESDIDLRFESGRIAPTITSNMDSSQISIGLSSTSGLVSGDELLLGSERIIIGNISGSIAIELTRGAFETTPAAHDSGTIAYITTKGMRSVIFGHLQEDNYMYYDYRLHNNYGTTLSVTPINETLNQLGPLFDLDAPAPPADTNVPVTISNKFGRTSSRSPVTLTCSDDVSCTSTLYCQATTKGSTCTPSITYSVPIIAGENQAWYSVCYASTDGTNTGPTVCSHGLYQVKK